MAGPTLCEDVLATLTVECPECGATHSRPMYIDPEDPPGTVDKTCIEYHPARDAGFEGCGRDLALDVNDVEVRDA